MARRQATNVCTNVLAPNAFCAYDSAMPSRTPPPKAEPRMGRRPIEDGFDTVTVGIKMSTRQREKLKALGGSAWVRDRIEKAKEPTEKD